MSTGLTSTDHALGVGRARLRCPNDPAVRCYISPVHFTSSRSHVSVVRKVEVLQERKGEMKCAPNGKQCSNEQGHESMFRVWIACPTLEADILMKKRIFIARRGAAEKRKRRSVKNKLGEQRRMGGGKVGLAVAGVGQLRTPRPVSD
ncbi:uncharacterized protein BXZ73DRAFT_82354 [Epithele typhae]|uniref:uncharacterized protein n=1 Tax=Epithele typhae TaxID=378194 RepID=UPI002008E4D8|nr:uncharacterized protein BXZ73DRAFT_82354 [Epithele typhae]KAH9912346.1 hypothetical protein BXZ73DRAFT_82354 [Epithele typhae]